MAAPFFGQTLASAKATGTAFNTFTTAKSVINTTELVPIPGNYLQLGSRFWGMALLGLSNTAAAATFNVNVNMGSTSVLASGNLQMSTTANTSLPVWVQWFMRLNAAGSGTNANFIGQFFVSGLAPQLGAGVANPTVTDSVVLGPAGTPAAGSGFDSTVSNILDFWVGFGTSAAGNQVTVFDYQVVQLN